MFSARCLRCSRGHLPGRGALISGLKKIRPARCSSGETASSQRYWVHSKTPYQAVDGSWSSAESRGSVRVVSPRSWRAGLTNTGGEVLWGRCWEAEGAPPVLAVGSGDPFLRP